MANEMSADEMIVQGLAQQTFSERMEMAAYLKDLIHDYLADTTEPPAADEIASWLEVIADAYLETPETSQ